MYDWIPIEFDYDILIKFDGAEYAHYHCISNNKYRESFSVFIDDHMILSAYSIDALLESIESGSKINGMTIDELKDSYYLGNEEEAIDIEMLI